MAKFYVTLYLDNNKKKQKYRDIYIFMQSKLPKYIY